MCNTKSQKMREAIALMTSRGDYDVAIAEYTVMGQYVHRNQGINPRTKRVISCHECYTIARKKALDFYGPFSRPGFQSMLDLYRLKSYEFEMYREADKVLTLTPEEREGLLMYDPDLDIEVVPHGVDIEHFVPQSGRVQEKALGFLGNYPHNPNRDAVIYFLTDIWPQIKNYIQGIKFYVIGRGPTDDILAIAKKDPDIFITGEVDDVREYLKRLKVFVAPIRLGRGFRGKILEAMAMGIPVVTTRLGAEGMPVHEGENIMFAENPEEFTRKTVELFNNEKLYQSISLNARSLVKERFSWQKGVQILEDVLLSLIEGH